MFGARNRIAGRACISTRRLFCVTLKNPSGLARIYSNLCSLCSGFEPEARRIKRFSLKTCHFRSVPGTAVKPRSAYAGRGARSTSENSRIFQVLSVLDRMSIGAVVRALSLSGKTEEIKTRACPWYRKLRLTESPILTPLTFLRFIKTA